MKKYFFLIVLVMVFVKINTANSQTFPDINNDTTYLHTIPVSQAGTLTERLYMDTTGLNGLIDDMLYDNRNYERYYSKYGVMLRFNSKYFINNIPNENLPNYNTQDTLVVNFLNNFKTKYGKFYLEDNYTSPNTIGIDFHLSFDSIVNINSVLRYFEQNNQVINSFKSIIYPVKTLSIPNIISKNINIFPNPTSNKISIDLGVVEVADLNIYDILGNKIISIPNYTNKTEMDVSNLSKGTYYIRYNSQSAKFIKE